MRLSWIKFLVAGAFLIVIVIFSAIALFNIAINKIPFSGQEKGIPNGTIGYNYSLHYSGRVAGDDPIRKNLLTEDQAWEYAWSFFHNKEGMSIFLPMEKRSLGLHRLIDNENIQYPVWTFDAMQNDRSAYFITGCSHGGLIDIDAYTGNILSFIEIC